MIRSLFASFAFLGLVATAGAADLSSNHYYGSVNGDIAARHQAWWDRGRVPECGESFVINSVANKFSYGEAHVSGRELGIGSFDRIAESSFRPGDPGLIDRRYCEAHVTLSNGKHSIVYYLLEERQGLASIGWNVEFCLIGHDPWRVHDGWCRAIRR